MDDFLQTVALLRAKHHRPAGFNLFSVLRSSSDEVNLHSRFLAFLLNPKASHNCGAELLQHFLSTMEIEGFDVTNATVQTEYQNIDVLIRNPAGQAIIIENKIYAGDQPEQLVRYHQCMVNEGCKQIWTLYLTLDGHEPEEHSGQDLDVMLASYETDIIDWLTLCIQSVAREAGVRESVFQYIDLLRKLTHTDQGSIYMEELKRAILKDENIFLIADINRAFKRVVIDFHTRLWESIKAYQAVHFPEMGTPRITADKDAVKKYHTGSKNNRKIGLHYDFGVIGGGIKILVDHRLYLGYYCDAKQHPQQYQKLLSLTGEQLGAGRNEPGQLFWKHSSPKLNLHELNNEDLAIIINAEATEALVKSIVEDAHRLWKAANSTVGEAPVARAHEE
ncbi:PD-(D/E)XK nuclease family protein [Pseudomonas resinovorans]|uniref:PDDEXK-like family protein n=1 Tax=Metapseudomonas resinovorans TaxID=53412 RepID=UPI00237F9C3A|nr:PD-(D/E)XK nuclease family protein [Pseudomonas resinovorans]MDE3738567.1 PD-(D/E)XK nuclease family protein [Pseudomonas resinovorans]